MAQLIITITENDGDVKIEQSKSEVSNHTTITALNLILHQMYNKITLLSTPPKEDSHPCKD